MKNGTLFWGPAEEPSMILVSTFIPKIVPLIKDLITQA